MKTKTTPLHTDLSKTIAETKPEYLEGSLKLLTILEKNVLRLLYDAPGAVSVMQVREYIIREYVYYFSDQGTLSKRKLRIYIEKENLPKPNVRKRLVDQIRKLNVPGYDHHDKKASILIKYTRIPSFEKISNVIDGLVEFGFVVSRPSPDKRVNALYAMNPVFYAFVKKHKIKL